MSATEVTVQPTDRAPKTREPLDRDVDRYQAVRQHSLAHILGVGAAAAFPMGVLAWIVAPRLKDQFSGPEPLIQSLLVCLTAGLVWQFLLVLIVVRREIGALRWSRVRDALWSAWMGIIEHSGQSLLFTGLLLALVLT